ncbi:FMN-binding protein [Clostridiaceae bacterium 35-E11]
MRKIIILALMILTIGLAACGKKEVRYLEGTYEGVGQGHHGSIKVLVTTDAYRIKKIQIVEEQEMPGICEIVYEKIPERVIKANSTDVDVVAGASFTSNGMLEAIREGLEKAQIKEKS